MDLPTTHYDKPVEAKREVKSKEALFKKISFYVFLVSVFFAPLVFIPSLYAPLDVVKTVFLSLTVLVAAILYVAGSYKSFRFIVTRSAVCYAALGIVISIIISTLLATSVEKSFIGQGFELGTASFLLLMFLVCGLVKRFAVRDAETVFKIYSVFFVSFIILALFHIIRFFGGADFMSFGVLNHLTATIAGKWYDFAILSGAATLLSFISLKFLPLHKPLKRILSVAFVVSMILLFLVNALFVWIILALTTLFIAIYEYHTRPIKGAGGTAFFSRISLFTFIVFLIAVGLAWKGRVITAPIMNNIPITYVEPVLSWQLTLDVTANSIKESPLFGAGPGRFGYEYLRHKPASINQTPFWNTEFTSGFGLVPSFLVTQGFVGMVLWLLFFVLLVREGIRSLKRTTEPLKKFLLTSSFFITVFLWMTAFVYVPSHATLFITFVFSGLFMASLIRDGHILEKELKLGGKNHTQFAFAGFVICLVVLLFWFGMYFKKSVAITHYEKGIKMFDINRSLDGAENHFKKALSWDSSDVYYRALSEMSLLKVAALNQEIEAETAKNGAADPKKVEQAIALMMQSIKYAKEAQKIDQNNYYNYIAEARISELGTSLKIPNAYENAKLSYANALKTNPYNPAFFLAISRLEASQGKATEAEQAVGRALQLKPNYTEAVFFLSQLQVAGNKLAEAIISTKAAISLTPNEPLLHFQLGLLEYNNKNYSVAITSLERAVALNDQYANAQYFLGLAYARLGNNEKAIAQFESLAISNPDNKEVAFILSNLKAGKSPFTAAVAPIDNTPEKRKTLPVPEKTPAEKTTQKVTVTPKATTSPKATTTPKTTR